MKTRSTLRLASSLAAAVAVLAACAEPCGDGQFVCEANHTCWSTELEHCAFCLAGDKETCACYADGAGRPDGATCEFNVSGDVVCGGVCQAGSCRADPETCPI